MDDNASNASDDSNVSNTALSPGCSTLLAAYSSEMIHGINEETEGKYENMKNSEDSTKRTKSAMQSSSFYIQIHSVAY